MKHLARFLTRSISALLMGVVLVGVSVAADVPQSADPVDTATIAPDSLKAERLIVTYFHGNSRCATCRKLEAYAQEAVDSSFSAELKTGSLEWQTVNFDEEVNAHYLKDYGLFNQAVILSYVKDGKEMAWKNLDKIWQLVSDRAEYEAYIQSEIAAFLAAQKK